MAIVSMPIFQFSLPAMGMLAMPSSIQKDLEYIPTTEIMMDTSMVEPDMKNEFDEISEQIQKKMNQIQRLNTEADMIKMHSDVLAMINTLSEIKMKIHEQSKNAFFRDCFLVGFIMGMILGPIVFISAKIGIDRLSKTCKITLGVLMVLIPFLACCTTIYLHKLHFPYCY